MSLCESSLTWWKDAGQPQDVLRILKNHGVNMVGLRPASRSGLDDFAQHDGAAGAGDAGKISGQAVQGAVGKDSEGDSLFGIHRQAVTIRELDRLARRASESLPNRARSVATQGQLHSAQVNGYRGAYIVDNVFATREPANTRYRFVLNWHCHGTF